MTTRRRKARAVGIDGRLQCFLAETVRACRRVRGGKTAGYIPQLASADPNLLGIAICSLDGTVESAGDAEMAFTIQSACKPFLYGAALERFGADRVHERVGVEPTGREFNSFTHLDSATNRPSNPMVNAGAIAVTDLLMVDSPDISAATDSVLRSLSRFVGRDAMEYDVSVFESERDHATRNRVIAHLMKHFDLVTGDVEVVLNAYFKACSVKVTCHDLALMAACLANHGVSPITKERVVASDVASKVLTLMSTCGMYDSSGAFAYEVGLPAKSGVSGAIVAVVPGHFGVAVYSPRVDAAGNSVKGKAVLDRFSKKVGGHFVTFSSPIPHKHVGGVLESALSHAFKKAQDATGGELAAYLPHVDPSKFAVAVCTVDGYEQGMGDVESQFSLQAIANPLSFALLLDHVGNRAVRRVVGVEPSGNPFHAILINQRSQRPYNPLGNAGALAVAGLGATTGSGDWADEMPGRLAALANAARPLGVDDAVLEAEMTHGNRNRAIAHLLFEVGALSSVEGALQHYLRQCACLVTCRELARIGCTLARGGVQAFSGRRLIRERAVRSALTVMYTCGMHEQSGQFAFDIGLPAKSGLSGGLLAVAPGRMGIAAYAPPVDSGGTSVRGRVAIRELTKALGLSLYAGSAHSSDDSFCRFAIESDTA